MKYFAKSLTNKKRQALFPAGTIVEGFYHRKPLEVCTITNIAEKPEAGFETSSNNHYTTAPKWRKPRKKMKKLGKMQKIWHCWSAKSG